MKIFNYIFLLFALGLTISCVDQEFDAPPIQGEDSFDIPDTNTTIAELKASHATGQIEEITEDLVFKAIVIADDQSGNLYKNLILEDETGGIVLSINATSLYNIYPIGMEVYVKCKGLLMGDYAGTISLGGSTFINNSGNPQLGGIEELLVQEYIVRGLRDKQVPPTVATINQLSSDDISTLITLENVQFTDNELGRTFADAINLSTVNLNLEDCDGNVIVVRTSGFSDFASEIVPGGSGTLTAVYGQFNTTKQLLIRNLEDFNFAATRCDGTGTDPGNQDLPEVNKTIADLKADHVLGDFTEITDDVVFKGIITADDRSGNLFKNIILQDESAGIVLKLNVNDIYNNYPEGTELFVKAKGLLTADYAGTISIGGSTFTNNSGDLQLGGIEEGQLSTHLVKGESNQALPIATKTISELGPNDISTIVLIQDIEFADNELGSTFADASGPSTGFLEMLDCDGNELTLLTNGYADFADQTVPGGSGTVTAIYGVFNETMQLQIRNPNDLDFGSTRCDGTTTGNGDPGEIVLEENFEDGQTQYELLNLAGWTNAAEIGTDAEAWYSNNYQGDFYAEGTAYQSGDPENVFWLVTPTINLDKNIILEFISAQHHWAHDGLSIMIANDFTGDVTDASWENVTCSLPQESNAWYEKVSSGKITLRDYFPSGNVHVGFRYSGKVGSQETTYQLHAVTLTEE